MTTESDFGWAFLEDILEWIANNYNPENIFDKEELADWAQIWVSGQGTEDILSVEQLTKWAESNGFVREE